jgi:hypothetical protein
MESFAQSAATRHERSLAASILEQARILSLLYDIGKELTSILDRDTLLRKIGQRVKSLVDYDLFNVMVLKRIGSSSCHFGFLLPIRPPSLLPACPHSAAEK